MKEKVKLSNYSEIRILFDEHDKEDSKKDKMMEKRAGFDPRDGDGYVP